MLPCGNPVQTALIVWQTSLSSSGTYLLIPDGFAFRCLIFNFLFSQHLYLPFFFSLPSFDDFLTLLFSLWLSLVACFYMPTIQWFYTFSFHVSYSFRQDGHVWYYNSHPSTSENRLFCPSLVTPHVNFFFSLIELKFVPLQFPLIFFLLS